MNQQQPEWQRLATYFHLEVEESEQIKSGVYRIKATNGKTYCIKKMDYPHEEVAWIDQALKAIMGRGHVHICWSDPSENRKQLIRLRQKDTERIYVLTPWVSGRTPKASEHKDMHACAQELATFHMAGRDIQVQRCKARDWLGQWPKLFREYKHVIKTCVREAEHKQLPQPMKEMLTTHGKQILLEATKAIGILQNSNYQQLCLDGANKRTCCHADSGPKNFVFSNEGPVLIDFETLRMDLRIYDIYRMIRLANKSNRWDFSIAQTILDGYCSVDEISKSEYDLLAAWLLFPHKSYRILRKYSNTNTEGKRELEKKLYKELEARMFLPQFLQNLHEYANRG